MQLSQKNISSKFSNYGKFIKPLDYNTDINDLDRNLIISNFIENGVLIFDEFKIDSTNLTKFTDKFTSKYAVDAPRREKRFNNKNINNVDSGNDEIKLHSEASYTTAWPEIIWFYCEVAASKGAQTTLCDGIKLWSALSKNTRKFFLSNPIVYKVSIPIRKKVKNKTEKQEWYIDNVGVRNSFIDWKAGELNMDIIKFAVHKSRIEEKLSFANHLIVDLKSEPQIKSRKLYNGQDIPFDILNEISEKAEELTYEVDWNNNQLAMIDNKRFLHGRRIIDKNTKRDIVNIQTFEANFPYRGLII